MRSLMPTSPSSSIPNNPTGRLLSRDTPGRAGAKLRRRDGLLIVDEAFADLTPCRSLAAELPPSTIVLRSFGKVYGLAGLSLGFAITVRRHGP